MDKNHKITLQTTKGDITIELDSENTPLTVENFLGYARAGFYDGTLFHRVINGFMIQGGGFDANMQQKTARATIQNEADHAKPNLRGTVAMARRSEPHSASAQFFINVADNNFLNHVGKNAQGWGYCVFGKVVAGMDIVDKIKAVATTSRAGHSDVPVENIVIEKVIIQD
jgi:peptidyl-prolyl cis-trans isomerase B (cyclophilin B)